MDRFDAMATLLAAIETGSLSAASRKLGMPLATVSRKVSDLEAHLRTRLVIRSSRRLTLTEAGRSYVAAARRILDELEEAERMAAGEYTAPRGDLVVSAPIVFGRLHILPIVLDFLKAYPDIDVRMTLTDRMIDLAEDRVDLAVRIGDLPDSSLIALRVGAIRRVVCASPGYFATRGRPETPADLARHDCITFEGLMSAKSWIFQGKQPEAIPVRSRLAVNTAEAAMDAAVAGFGVTRLLSYQVAHARAAGALSVALEAFEPAPVPVSLVYPGQPMMPLKLRAFLDFVAPRLKGRFSGMNG